MDTKMSLRTAATLLLAAIALPAHSATIAYFDFEGGTNGANATTVADGGDGSNTLTVGTAAPSYSNVTVPVGTPTGSQLAMDFDAGEHLEVQNLVSSSWVSGAYSNFTLESWVYFSDTLGSWQTMVGRDDTGNPGEGTAAQSLLYFSKHDQDWLRVELVTASNQLIAVDPGAAFAVSPNVWYHMAAVGDATAGTLSLYVNGELQGSTTGFDGLYDPGTDTTWSVGRGQFAGNDADNFNGLLDDVRFSDVALTPSQFLYVPPSFLWTADADGIISNSANWQGGNVPGSGDNPTFGSAITANRTVTLDSNVAYNSVTFNNSGDGDYFIVPATSQTLTLTGDALVSTTGRHWLRAPVAGTSGLHTTGGGELVLDAVNTFSGGLTVNGTNVAVVNDGAIPAGNAITLQGTGDLRFYGAGNGFFTGQGSAGYGTGTINSAVSVANGSILGVFDGVNLTLAGPVAANGVLSADNATLNINGATTFTIADNNVSGSIVGAGTVNLNGAFNINTGGVTDTLGGWTLINVNTLTETFGAGFSVNGFTETAGIWTNGGYAFNESTGVLSLGDVWAADADGNYSDGPNWNSGVAPGANADVLFSNVITENRNVTLTAGASVNSVTFDNAGDGDYFIVDNGGGETLTFTGDAQVNVNGRHWMRAPIGGTAGLNISGAGELVLDAPNTFSGNLAISNTNTAVTDAGAIPAGVNISVADDAELRFWGTTNAFFNGTHGTGYTSGSVTGTVSLSADSELQVNDGATVAFTNVISGGGLVSIGGGNATFSAANTYSGVTNVTNGSLTISNAAALGAGDGTAATRTFIAGNGNNGTLALTGGITVANELLGISARELAGFDEVHVSSTGNNTWSGNIRGETGGTQYNFESTSGTLTLSGTMSAPDSAVRNFVFSGDGNFVVNKLTDAVVDVAGAVTGSSTSENVSVTKRGAGTLTINTLTDNNDDYYFGDTVIEQGTVKVNSPNGTDGELRSTVIVQNGATLDLTSFTTYNLIPTQAGGEVGLGGGGLVNIGSGRTVGAFESSTITPGDSVGTLNITGNLSLTYFDVGSATVPDSGSLNFELGNTASTIGGTENDLVDVTGTLTTNGNGLASSFIVNVTPVEGAFDTSTNYTLMRGASRSGTANFTANIVDSTGAPIESRYNTPTVVLTSNAVQLQVTGAAASRTWTGSVNNQWDAQDSGSAGTANWSAGDNLFMQLDNVTFNSTGGGGTVNVAENVAPGTMTVSSTGYSFTGNQINAGSIAVNSGANASFSNAVSASAVTVASNATADFANLSGNVNVQSTGTLGGRGTYQNNVSVLSGGTLRVGAASLPVSSSHALVDDFNYDNDSDSTLAATGGVWTARPEGSAIPQIATRSGADNSLSTHGPTWVGAVTDLSTNYDLDHSLADGGKATYFFEVMWDGTGIPDTMIGMARETNLIDNVNAWQDYQVMPFVSQQGNNNAVSLRADPAAGGDPAGDGNVVEVLTGGQWYNVWLVVDNEAQTYDIYTSTGTDAGVYKQTSVYVNNGGGPGDLNAFGISGQLAPVVHIDNLYRLSGEDTSNPLVTPGTDTFVGEVMTVQGNVSLVSGSDILFDAGKDGQGNLAWDKLVVDGNFTAGGDLTLALAGTSSPLSAGDTVDLFDFGGSVSGSFASLTLPTLSGSLQWDTSSLLVDGTLLVTSLANLGDFNNDGVVDAADYTTWRDNLGDADETNINGNGDGGGVTQSDYLVWRNNYGTVYGLGASVTSNVPEPTAALLLAGVALLGISRRSRA